MRINRSELVEMLADKLTEVQDSRDLEQFFFDHQYEYYKQESDEKLEQDARDLGLVDDDDVLTILED